MALCALKEIIDSMYARVDDLDKIVPSLSEVRSSLSLDHIQSCVAVGCGYGRLELIFVNHCMPHISKFIAIEPDRACAAELREKLPHQLPNVDNIVCEETVQTWQGAGHPVDAVLLIHFLYYLSPTERLALFRRLMDDVLQSGSYVFILIHPHHTSGKPSAYSRVIQLLKSSNNSDELVSNTEVSGAMATVGFELCYERMYHCHLNVADPDDAFLSLIRCPDDSWSLQSVRQAANDVFKDAKQVRHDSWLGIFRKP